MHIYTYHIHACIYTYTFIYSNLYKYIYAYTQAQDRAHRIGQRNEVRVFRLVTTSPIEEKILARATDKKNLNSLAVEAGQFNKTTGSGNSTGGSAADDKKELMQSLLKEWSESAEAESNIDKDASKDVNEDNDVPDDDQLNQLMAIHDCDLVIYKEMDQRREQARIQEWQERHANSTVIPPLPDRLMSKEEMPQWITEDAWNTKTMAVTVMGTAGVDVEVEEDLSGGRKRKEVIYDDGMTDAQYCKAMEAKADDIQAEEKRQKLEETERREKKRKDSLPPGPRIPDDICKKLEKMVQDLVKMTKEDGTQPSYYFKVKPDKKVFFDYYDVIEQPISFKEIKYRLSKRQYTDMYAFERDFALLCSNARTYNPVGSMVYDDSEYLRNEFYDKLAVICKDSNLRIIKKPLIDDNGDVVDNGDDNDAMEIDNENDNGFHTNDDDDDDDSPLKLKINLKRDKSS